MSCKVLAICDSDHSYGELLTKQLLRIPGNRLEIRNFTEIEKLRAYAKDKVITYLLVSETYKAEVEDLEALTFYFLTEDKEKTESISGENKDVTYLYRYQPAHEIYTIISGGSSGEAGGMYPGKDSLISQANQEIPAQNYVEFIGIYQPVHRNGSTTVAKSMGRIKGESGKVLYVNLEEYPGHMTKELERDAIELGEGNLGDMLYYLKQSTDMAKSRLETTVHKLTNYHVLAPIGVSEELRQITWGEWEGFLEILKGSDYTTIIFDIHSCVQGFVDLLERCHVVYSPEIMGRGAIDKHKSFQQEMRLLGKTQMLLKMETLVIPEYLSNVDTKVEEKLRDLLDKL